jgi:hypothetical protein
MEPWEKTCGKCGHFYRTSQGIEYCTFNRGTWIQVFPEVDWCPYFLDIEKEPKQ